MVSKEDLISFSVELVQNNIERTIRGISHFGSDSYKKIKVNSGAAFKSYLETAIRKYSDIKTILYRDAPVFLYKFYEDSELLFGDNVIDASDLDNLLQVSDKIIITGSAGTGKSTLMKHLFLSAIANKNRIPIFVELKNINNIPDIVNLIHSGEYRLLDFIYHSVKSLNFSFEEEYFIRAIDNGNLFFYFDGFDEVNPEIRELLSLQIIELSDKYYENVIIVSSRPDEGFVAWNSFCEIRMLPLSKKKALSLMNKIEYESEMKERFIDELDKNLYERHKSFASNPLLLTIMLMSFSQYSDIPEKIYLFYQQAFETLFTKHDSTKGGYKRKMYTNLAMDDFVKVLSAFAIQSYSNNNISFDYTTISKYLNGAKK
ncbi:NACHT domain-containing protein [Cohnella cholangitidis]|nr:NACHT domain-containing protein [Cohnella cholangitidis]